MVESKPDDELVIPRKRQALAPALGWLGIAAAMPIVEIAFIYRTMASPSLPGGIGPVASPIPAVIRLAWMIILWQFLPILIVTIVAFVWERRQNPAILVLKPEGIAIHIAWRNIDLLAWADIAAIRLVKMPFYAVLGIYPKDPEAVASRLPKYQRFGFWEAVKYMRRAKNPERAYPPIGILSSPAQSSWDEVLWEIRDYQSRCAPDVLIDFGEARDPSAWPPPPSAPRAGAGRKRH